MSSRTPGDAIKNFVDEILSSNLLSKYDQILELISGPITIARDKINVIDTVGDISDFVPDIPPEYKADLRRSVVQIYHEEVKKAASILEKIEGVIGNLRRISETFNQRTLEGFRSQNVLVINNRELLACQDDCRRILIYLKLKTNIFKHYLNTPFKDQPTTVPLSNFKSYEDTGRELIQRLQVIQLPLAVRPKA